MSVLARFDDWLNPIAVKELRQAVRGKFVMVALILSLLAMLIAVAVITITSALGNTNARGPAGPYAFTLLFSVVFTAAIFLIPMYSGFRMAAERSDSNVDLLFITTIRPRTIVLGKVIATAGLVALLFSASLPFLMFSYVLRGVDFLTILFLIGFAMLLVISHSITAMFIGCLPTSRPFKILMAIGFFLATIGVYVPMLTLTAEVLRANPFSYFGVSQFWSGVLYGVVAMLAVDAILMVLMTAIITPASANRAMPIRIMLTSVAAIWYGAAMWSAQSSRNYAPLQLWSVVQIALATLVLLSATSERESWGPRVARTIPRNPLLRAVAFLFYSGSAGGTLWVMVMFAATVLAYHFSLDRTLGSFARSANLTRYLGDAALAMIAYAMTAVLLRRKVFKRIPVTRTWGVLLALFIVLTALPPLAIISRDAESESWETYVHITTMANPFPTQQRTEEARNVRTTVLGLWAGLATAANAAWFVLQMKRFRSAAAQPPLSYSADQTPAAALQ